jgi:hypothetical protein
MSEYKPHDLMAFRDRVYVVLGIRITDEDAAREFDALREKYVRQAPEPTIQDLAKLTMRNVV